MSKNSYLISENTLGLCQYLAVTIAVNNRNTVRCTVYNNVILLDLNTFRTTLVHIKEEIKKDIIIIIIIIIIIVVIFIFCRFHVVLLDCVSFLIS
jgi:hypothetical protein